MKKNVSLFMAALVVAAFPIHSLAASYSGGSGTTDNPYKISTPADLIALGKTPSDYDKCFILTADIDLAGRGTNADGSFPSAVIAPSIGAGTDFEGDAFNGDFIGNYRVISNLPIDTHGQDQSYLGLFGNILSGTVKRLGLKNVSVTCGDASAYVGTLAGVNQGAVIEQCYATGAIHGGLSSQYLGGLLNAYGGTVSDCYAAVNVFAGENAQVLGGFAGTAYGMLSNCYARGFVANRSSAGGFGGQIYPWFSYLFNCYYLNPGDGGGPNNAIAIALSDAAMRKQASFVNWDFQGSAADGEKEVWLMNGAYPALAWQVPVGIRQLAVLSRYWQKSECVSGQPCAIADWYDDDVIDLKDLALLTQSWLTPAIRTDYPKVADDFETGDFTRLPWVQGGARGWTVISGPDVYQGTYSARSGAIGNSQSSSLELTATVDQNSEIIAAVRISSESGHDNLYFYIDGSLRAEWSGETGWQEFRINFGPGTYSFKWSYSKDNSTTNGNDCAWIDNVRILRLEE